MRTNFITFHRDVDAAWVSSNEVTVRRTRDVHRAIVVDCTHYYRERRFIASPRTASVLGCDVPLVICDEQIGCVVMSFTLNSYVFVQYDVTRNDWVAISKRQLRRARWLGICWEAKHVTIWLKFTCTVYIYMYVCEIETGWKITCDWLASRHPTVTYVILPIVKANCDCIRDTFSTIQILNRTYKTDLLMVM